MVNTGTHLFTIRRSCPNFMEGDYGQKRTSIVLRDSLYCTCCDVPGDAIYYPVMLYRTRCVALPYSVMLYRTAHGITSNCILLYEGA